MYPYVMKYIERNGLMLIDWTAFSTDHYLETLEQYLADERAAYDNVSLVTNRSFASLVLPIEEAHHRVAAHVTPLLTIHALCSHAYENIDDVVEKVLVRTAEHTTQLSFHEGVYSAFREFAHSSVFSSCTAEEQYIVEQSLRRYERNGIHLAEDKRDRAVEIKKRLSEIANAFQMNVRKATDAFTVHADQDSVLGIPEHVLQHAAAHAEKEGKEGYCFSLRADVVNAVLSYARCRELRERVWYAHKTRASEIGPVPGAYDNTDHMQEMLVLRDELAQLLGFRTFAEYSSDSKMVKAIGVSGVENFLHTIASAAREKAKAEEATLLVYAQEQDGLVEFSPWDRAYYAERYQKENYHIDTEALRLYFPLSKVLAGLFALTKDLFQCTLREYLAPVWHPDVRFFEVLNDSSEVIAGFYVDLFAREGKRGGAWMNEIAPALRYGTTRSYPIAYLATNFRSPQKGEDAYLDHEEIQTLFHEFGHVLHHLFAETAYGASGMMNVEWDAVELPSQFFEYWCWNTEVIRGLSAHKNTGEVIPDALIQKIQRARHYLSGYMYAAQMTFALMDIWAHNGRHADSVLQIYKDAAGVADPRPVPAVLRFPHTFTHIFDVDGYEAGYFSYVWANTLVAHASHEFTLAQDVRALAQKYRKEILAVGASRPFMESFVACFGKSPDAALLLPYIGLAE